MLERKNASSAQEGGKGKPARAKPKYPQPSANKKMNALPTGPPKRHTICQTDTHVEPAEALLAHRPEFGRGGVKGSLGKEPNVPVNSKCLWGRNQTTWGDATKECGGTTDEPNALARQTTSSGV